MILIVLYLIYKFFDFQKLVPLWSTGEETVRVVAFLGLYSITRHMKKSQWLETVLKVSKNVD